MAVPKTIADLWGVQQEASFPASCQCAAVQGIDQILLDSNTAGCVTTLLVRDGRLDLWRVAVPGLCYHNLAVAMAGLEGEAHDYFARLEKLASLTLYAVRDTNAPD